MAKTMKALTFVEPGRIAREDRPVPYVGPTDALMRITTTVCGTDVHIVKGEYPVESGLIIETAEMEPEYSPTWVGCTVPHGTSPSCRGIGGRCEN